VVTHESASVSQLTHDGWEWDKCPSSETMSRIIASQCGRRRSGLKSEKEGPVCGMESDAHPGADPKLHR